jgi:hypothetical protein
MQRNYELRIHYDCYCRFTFEPQREGKKYIYSLYYGRNAVKFQLTSQKHRDWIEDREYYYAKKNGNNKNNKSKENKKKHKDNKFYLFTRKNVHKNNKNCTVNVVCIVESERERKNGFKMLKCENKVDSSLYWQEINRRRVSEREI